VNGLTLLIRVKMRRDMGYPARQSQILIFLGFLAVALPAHSAGRAPTTDARDAKILVKKVVGVFQHKNYSSRTPASGSSTPSPFHTESCPQVPKSKWLSLLLTGEPIVQEFKFASGCDIQGRLVITQGKFPVNLQVRHIEKIRRVAAIAGTQLQPHLSEQTVSVILRADKGEFFEKSPMPAVSWDAVYNVKMGFGGDLYGNNGGTMTVHAYHGRPVKVVEKLEFE
jgi:hypothetical protein